MFLVAEGQIIGCLQQAFAIAENSRTGFLGRNQRPDIGENARNGFQITLGQGFDGAQFFLAIGVSGYRFQPAQ